MAKNIQQTNTAVSETATKNVADALDRMNVAAKNADTVAKATANLPALITPSAAIVASHKKTGVELLDLYSTEMDALDRMNAAEADMNKAVRTFNAQLSTAILEIIRADKRTIGMIDGIGGNRTARENVNDYVRAALGYVTIAADGKRTMSGTYAKALMFDIGDKPSADDAARAKALQAAFATKLKDCTDAARVAYYARGVTEIGYDTEKKAPVLIAAPLPKDAPKEERTKETLAELFGHKNVTTDKATGKVSVVMNAREGRSAKEPDAKTVPSMKAFKTYAEAKASGATAKTGDKASISATEAGKPAGSVHGEHAGVDVTIHGSITRELQERANELSKLITRAADTPSVIDEDTQRILRSLYQKLANMFSPIVRPAQAAGQAPVGQATAKAPVTLATSATPKPAAAKVEQKALVSETATGKASVRKR